MSVVRSMTIGGIEVLPLVEGGKGVAASDGVSAGHWALQGGIGTFSGVNASVIDDNGEREPLVFRGKDRRERHEELIEYSIRGAISQARLGHELRDGEGRLHMNVLWEMGGCERVLEGALEGARGMIQGVTCGAGMPYRLAEICAHYGVHYFPIISSARAFRALWKRAYHKAAVWLGAVVYEDPWLAGGHNGLSNVEDPEKPQRPYERVAALRKTMRELGAPEIPIVMAGGVWRLDEWEDWIENDELGPVAFQFGTRPLLTVESPIPEEWKEKLRTLTEGDVLLQRFSPTGFYSSAVKNPFLNELAERNERQVAFSEERDEAKERTEFLPFGRRNRGVWLTASDHAEARAWMEAGFDHPMRTPDDTLIFVTAERSRTIKRDQANCMGCLSHCRFSNWKDHDDFTTGKPTDPRSFCIQKTLNDAVHARTSLDEALMFAGHNAFRFRTDPFYANGFLPTVEQLFARILRGQ